MFSGTWQNSEAEIGIGIGRPCLGDRILKPRQISLCNFWIIGVQTLKQFRVEGSLRDFSLGVTLRSLGRKVQAWRLRLHRAERVQAVVF